MILFAIFYHDIVFEVLWPDNEERSAHRAKRVMQELKIEAVRIERCIHHILATTNHNVSEDNDTNLFTDADLSILGMEPHTYTNYCSQVRKEYSVFTDTVYGEGRTKVLQSFLKKFPLFKTPEFQNQFEKQAKLNIKTELKSLLTN